MTSTSLRKRFASIGAAVAVSALVLVGCTNDTKPAGPEQTNEPGAQTEAPEAPTSPTPDPVFVPEGTAEDNLAYFTKIVQDQWAAGAGVDAKRYTDALAAAGFDKAAMQTGQSKTTIGNDVDSLQFSVLFKDQCLMGQVGSLSGDPTAVVMNQVAGGGCFIGNTVPVE